MIGTRKLRLDRITSSTLNARLKKDVIVGPEIVSREGCIVAVRVLTDKRVYNQVEDVSGRMVPVRSGDLLAGTLGSRRALKGYAGRVPQALAVGDRLQILNIGGVLGECTSDHPDLGPPFDGELLGSVLEFPPGGDRVGRPADIRRGAIPPAAELDCVVPMIFVVGTSMNSGKTVAATEIVRGLSRAGLAVGAVKLTGVALRRDTLSMVDAGAVAGLTFTDAGCVSTDEEHVLGAARGLLNHLARVEKPDVIVAELGDGILGDYGVRTLLADSALMSRSAGIVVCAPDQVGAWGACRLLDADFGLRASVVAGPATDNEVGCAYVRDVLGLPALNARRDPEALARRMIEVLGERD